MAPQPGAVPRLPRLLPRVGRLRGDRPRCHRLPLFVLGRRRLSARRRLARPDRRPPARMSWAAHDVEPYAFQWHLKLKVAFVPLLIGSYAPDMMTKWFVYGIHLGPWDLKASDPAQFHRGWPGFGFTHSFVYGLAIGLIL